jgi:Mor family transcriptional regulator
MLWTEIKRVPTRIYGGGEAYIPKPDRADRRAAVLREFDGKNRKELCARHNLSKAQFYRMLKGE